MEFINHFNSRGGRTSDGSFSGTAIFSDGILIIRLPNTKRVVEKGYIEGGFGVVTESYPPRKSPYTIVKVELDMSYLPNEFHGKNYKFRINAEQTADNEYVFLYKRAKMMNKK